mgnify:CR=1 FL=1
MIEIPVYSVDGAKTGSVSIDEAALGGELRPALLKQAYVAGHANRRQGNAVTKGRSGKHGSTRKLYRQKGTGRARRGNVRTNLLRGGGVAFAKVDKDWRQGLPTKMRRLANRNALLSKIRDEEIKIIDKFDFKAPKTKQFAAVLDALSVDRTCLLAVGSDDVNTSLSARNIADVDIIQIEQLNAYDLLSHRYLVTSKAAFEGYIASLQPTTGKASAESKEAA